MRAHERKEQYGGFRIDLRDLKLAANGFFL